LGVDEDDAVLEDPLVDAVCHCRVRTGRGAELLGGAVLGNQFPWVMQLVLQVE
jgi:hypothetical protein